MNAAEFVALGGRGSAVRKPPYLKNRFKHKKLFFNHKDLFDDVAWKSLVREQPDAEVFFKVRPRRHDHFAVLSWTTLKYQRLSSRVQSAGRRFLMIDSAAEMENFMADVPAYMRVFEEIIFRDTPHRWYMDIETDSFEEGQDVAQRIAYLENYLVVHFVRILAEFFNHYFGLKCRPEDFSLCFASSEKKFSCHLMLADGSYFLTRAHSWIAAALLASHLNKRAAEDEVFADFYNISSSEGGKIVDYNVYDASTRNMRNLGSISYKGGASLGRHWHTMRPFRPHASRETMHWTKFFATVNQAPRDPSFTRIEVDKEHFGEITHFINQEIARTSAISTNFKSLKPYLGASQGVALSLQRYSSLQTGYANNNYTGCQDALSNRLGKIVARINELGDPDKIHGHNLMQKVILAGKQMKEKERFFKVAHDMAVRMASLIHPNQPVRDMDPDFSRGEIARVRCSAFVTDKNGHPVYRLDESGNQKKQRMCLLSFDARYGHDGPCQGGQNQVDISILADFSMSYYCHSCKQRDGMAVQSPIRPNTIMPMLFCKGVPREFADSNINFIDYGLSLENDIDASPYMREIGAIDGYYSHPTITRTIMLHGGMGTGKSTVCSHFLEKAEIDINRQFKRPPRVLSISFRQMLARSSAERFNLLYYNEEGVEESLCEFDKVAIQLDSIKRLGGLTEDNQFNVREFDILLLDESESILSHLSSETMEHRRGEVFMLLKILVRRSKIVIVADADMNHRTYEFIRHTRPMNSTNHDLTYHRNPFVKKEIHYIDYKYFNKWVESIENSLILRQKKIFIVSNNKKKLKSVCSYIKSRLDSLIEDQKNFVDRMTTRQKKHFDWMCEMQIDPHFMKIIDGDMSGAEKKNMAVNCNEEWSNFNLLAITPVVGAGIDFNKEGCFHEAFLLATPSSCTPRAINQLLGRVRHLKENRVRIYIDDNKSLSSKVDRLDADTIYNEQKLHNQSIKRIKLDQMSQRVDDGWIKYTVQSEDELLMRIVALNEEEKRKGVADFRSEFIQTLQKNNPSVNYTFNLTGSFAEDTKTMTNIRKSLTRVEDTDLIKLAIQDEESREKTEELRAKNDRGQVCFGEEEAEKQDLITAIITKNELKVLLGIADGTSDEIYEAYMTLLGCHQDSQQVIVNIAKFMFTSLYSLFRSQEKLMSPFEFQVDGEAYTAPSRVTQTFDALDHRKKYWLKHLLWIGGFVEDRGPETETGFVVNDLRGHTLLTNERIDDDQTQEWLREHAPLMIQQLGLSVKLKAPKPKSDKRIEKGERQWGANDISSDSFVRLLKAFLLKLFNIDVSISSMQEGEEGRKRELNYCSTHGTKCRIRSPDREMFRIYLAMAKRWLEVVDSNEAWILEARANSTPVMQQFGIGTLPGFSSEDQDAEMDEEQFVSYSKIYQQETRKRREQLFKAQRKKRPSSEAAKKSPEEKFEEEWRTICDVHIGTDMYFEQNAEMYLRKMLSEGYKFKTKQEMRLCYHKMLSNRKKLAAFRKKLNYTDNDLI